VKSQRKKPPGFSAEKAHAAQLKMAAQVVRRDTLPAEIGYVGGVDVAYTRETSIAAGTVLEFESLSLVEGQTARTRTGFPYIPTLLSFREIPPAVIVIRKIHRRPDVLLVDGQGIMHPYRLGLASHLGLVLNMPTIGVAKSPLIGEVDELQDGGWAPITDQNEIVGAALSTSRGAKPLYVSIGHKISLRRAIQIVKHCTPIHRIPKPIRLAHNLAAQEKAKLKTVHEKMG
jgi:deoxyribonuclease V